MGAYGGLAAAPRLPRLPGRSSRPSLSRLPAGRRQLNQKEAQLSLSGPAQASSARVTWAVNRPVDHRHSAIPMGFLSCFLILLFRLGNRKQIPAGASHAPQWAGRMSLVSPHQGAPSFPVSLFASQPLLAVAHALLLAPLPCPLWTRFQLCPGLAPWLPAERAAPGLWLIGPPASWFGSIPAPRASISAGATLLIWIQILILPTSSASFSEPEPGMAPL